MIKYIYISIFISVIFPPTMIRAGEATLLFNGNCATCHHIDKASSAPTIHEIRTRYKQAFPDKKDFVNYMSKWVVNPQEETSLMHDKIAKYGLMPQLAFEKESVEKIAEYIYDGKIEATTR